MSEQRQTTPSRSAAFTLIELLVVVSIISILIATLLPSLGTARGQARAMVCSSRMAQLAKAFMLYAEDSDELPPFVGVGYKSCGQTDHYNNLSRDPAQDEFWFASQETWLVQNMTNVWLNEDWVALKGTPSEPKLEAGSLFPYARFTNLYRCPEFERQPDKTQTLFNYTRSIMGRMALSSTVSDVDAKNDDGTPDALHPGPILKLSKVYAPAAMFLLLDEQWDFHCAGRYNDPGVAGLQGFPMAADSIHALVGDMIGSYHGTLTKAIAWPELRPSKQGNVAYYDGHVAPYQDPWPWRTASNGMGLGDLLMRALQDPQNGKKCLDPLLMSIYAQRGIAFTDQMLVELFRQIGA